MNINNEHSTLTPRESFLMGLLNRIIKEYKTLIDLTRRHKPFKIVELIELSNIPGETKFAIQLTNKNSVFILSAAEIINNKYNLNDFNAFHAEMIRQASMGNLANYLNLSDKESVFHVTSKKYDREKQQHVFTIASKDQVELVRTAAEIAKDKQ